MIRVACAIIVNSLKEVLVTQRSSEMDLPLKWEFPGGKIEEGETAEGCLLREIREELAIDIKIISSLSPVEHQYPVKKIELIPFVCEWISGEIRLSEHAAYRWLKVSELQDLDWADADIPIVQDYIRRSEAQG